MAATTTIPITVSPEAAARIDELGMRQEFEEMIEQTRRLMPEMRAIGVTLGYEYEEERDPAVVISPYRPEPDSDRDPLERQWDDWFADRFPPEVAMQFVLLSYYEPSDGR